jgi:hypothetical protein
VTGIGLTGAVRFHLMVWRSELSLDDPFATVAKDSFREANHAMGLWLLR